MSCDASWCIQPDDADVDIDGTVSHMHRSKLIVIGDLELQLRQYVAIKPDGVLVEPVQLDVCAVDDTPLGAAGVIELRAHLGDLLLDMIPATP